MTASEGEKGMIESGTSGPVQPLTEMIAYQQDAIVSRTILNKRNGTVTLFAFDANQSLSEHTAPYDALVYILEGEADITIAGNTYRVHAGEMITLPANRPHAVAAPVPFKMLLIMIRSQE